MEKKPQGKTFSVSARNKKFSWAEMPLFLAEKGKFFTQYFPRFLGGKNSKDTGLHPRSHTRQEKEKESDGAATRRRRG